MPEPQSAVGRNPTALFHLYARIVIRRAANAIDRFGVRVFLGALHASPGLLRFSRFSANRSLLSHRDAHAVRAYPVGVRKKRPLHSPFTDRAVGKMVGSSPTSTMQKTEYGWMRSAGRWIGAAAAARAGGSSFDAHRAAFFISPRTRGRDVAVRVGAIGCARNRRAISHFFFEFFMLTTLPARIVTSNGSIGRHAGIRSSGFSAVRRGKTSVGIAMRDS
ncbi:hypothetical protein [Burkholderia dolosa]|uniref:hypothetical protein n=1 Tax=Burkholderia dolosa TaxID=152500 RepID=UPI001C95B6F4|nr:hypothetical protein [Burkholderia dolosa]MBY4830439.1 hypothetical protein [Burkholderia dolosa]